MDPHPYFASALKEEFAKRCELTPGFSTRAFARALKIDAGALSRILSGKQVPSYKLAQKILTAVDLSPEKQKRFLVSLGETHQSRGLRRMSKKFKNLDQVAPEVTELNIDYYRLIAAWYHAAILELTFVEGFKPQPRWIAKELGISEAEARLAVERLLRLGLLTKVRGTLQKTDAQLTTADKNVTTPALRKNQREFLEKAIHSLENDPLESRSMTSMTMAIDESKIPEAKKLIRKFNRDLCALLETGPRKRVFNLGVVLYPLQSSKGDSK